MNRSCLSVSGLYAALVICVAGFAGVSRGGSAPTADPNVQAPVIVAGLGDVTISRDDLVQRLLQEIRPHEEEFYREGPPVTAESVLRKMLAEKATSMEGRRLGYDRDDQIRRAVSQLEQSRIVTRLLETELGSKVEAVADSDVNEVMKSRPTLTREQAKMMVQRAMAVRLMEQFYKEVAGKRKLAKVSENLPKAAAIHQRLLTQPRQPRGPTEYWIRNSQVSTDLSEDEKGMLLATFEGGQFTLKDWFLLICEMAPPRRPKDLDKPEGVEKLLDMGLRGPVLAAEAKSRGYDNDPKLRSELRKLEDDRLLYKTQEEKVKPVVEPTPEQVKAYFDEDPSRFATNPVLKVDQIWCADLETARKLKESIDQGADFEALRKEHSLQKDVSPYSLSPGSEGLFWSEIAKGEPNQVLGPVPGFYGSGAKWRLIKIHERTSAKTQAYSEQLANSAKWVLFGGQRQKVLRDLEKELLEKYPHEVFTDRIEDLDPVEIVLKQQDK